MLFHEIHNCEWLTLCFGNLCSLGRMWVAPKEVGAFEHPAPGHGCFATQLHSLQLQLLEKPPVWVCEMPAIMGRVLAWAVVIIPGCGYCDEMFPGVFFSFPFKCLDWWYHLGSEISLEFEQEKCPIQLSDWLIADKASQYDLTEATSLVKTLGKN